MTLSGADPRDLRVLVAHPWVVHQRGGERTFYEIARAFPSADVALLFQRANSLPADIAARVRRTSFVDGAAFRMLPYRALAPLLPMAAEAMDVSDYDLIISSSSGWAHGLRAASHARHLCYMYTPPRYVWTNERVPGTIGVVSGPAMVPIRAALRAWDRCAARRVDSFAAISQLTRARIRACYGADASVLHPPVDVARMQVGRDAGREFALTVGEFVPYKRIDLAIRAARAARVPLVVVGDGPERARLQHLAEGSRVTFTGRVSEAVLIDLMARARVFLYPAVEDFGIVTVEALASGTPVVGVREGGTGEIVREGMGELVEHQDEDLLADALRRAWTSRYERPSLRARAEEFRPERFIPALRTWVAAALASAAAPVAAPLRLPEAAEG